MCVLFCENANYNFADFSLGFLLGRLCGGLFVIYVFLVFYVMRTNVLSCLRLDERWSLKIEVEAAAGVVFCPVKASDVGKARRPFIEFSEK